MEKYLEMFFYFFMSGVAHTCFANEGRAFGNVWHIADALLLVQQTPSFDIRHSEGNRVSS